jgi:hypothetical protein
MGWDRFTRYSDAPRTAPAIEAFLRNLYTWSDADTKRTVVGYEKVPGAAFVALHVEPLTPAEGHRHPFTTAIVVLLENEGGALAWKTMDEGAGPYEARASADFLKLLSPLELLPYPTYAAEWRKRVLAGCAASTTAKEG